MTLDPWEEPGTVALAGDWHMNATYARTAIRYAHERGAEVVLHLGDFGYLFAPDFVDAVEGELAEYGMRLLFVDGNHEDHYWLREQPIDGSGLRPLSEHIWHLPRGTRWEWCGLRFVALGGAHSVDRQRRTPGVSWWAGETITWMEATRVAGAGPADIMLCHDCPAGVDIPGLQSGLFPAAEIEAAEQHRGQLRAVVDVVNPRWLWHGHYHVRYEADLALLGGTCKVTGLSLDGGPLDENIQIVNLVDLFAELPE